jgi:hypothetical protein
LRPDPASPRPFKKTIKIGPRSKAFNSRDGLIKLRARSELRPSPATALSFR